MDVFSILLILYFIFFLGLTIKNFKWAIYLIIFGLPSYLIRFEINGLPMTLLEGMILILFFYWLVKSLKHKNIKTLKQRILNYKLSSKFQRQKSTNVEGGSSEGRQIINYKYLFITVFLFLISATIAMFVGPELRVAAGIWKAYFIEPILFLIVLISVIKKEDFKILFRILSWQVGLLSLVAIYQKITGNLIANNFWATEVTRRVTGVFEYPNALALYLAPIIILLMGFLFKRIENNLPANRLTSQGGWQAGELRIKNILYKVFISLSVVIGILAVYFTKSKGALLGILVGMIFYAIFYKSARKYFVGFLLVIILISGYVLQAGKINIKGNPTVEGGGSVSIRLDMWKETYELFKDQPILGAGLAGYQTAIKPYHQKNYIEIYLYPHNIFLNFWSELGLLGLLSWLGVVGWFYVKGYQLAVISSQSLINSKQLSIILMASMTTLLIHGLVDVPYFKNDLSILFWLLIGLMIVLDKIKFGESKKNKV